ncbi:MAG: DMT family transporter [Acidimicrobiales bacterium]
MTKTHSAITRPSTVDLALLGLAVAAVSTSAPLVRLAAAPTLAVAFWRNALSLPVVGSIVIASRRPEVARLTGRELRLSVVAGLFLALHFAAWVPSLSYTSVASSVALVSTMPVWSAVLSRVRGDHIPGRVWAGIAVAMAGVLLLTGVDVSLSVEALFGDGLALAGGALAAAYVHVGAEVRQTLSTSVYASLCYAVAATVLLAVCLLARQELVVYPAGTWLVLAGITIGPQLLGHTVVNRVLRTTGPTVVSLMILLEILGSTFLAWIMFDEAPAPLAYPAAALIVVGVLVVVRTGREPEAAPAAPLAAD